MGHANARRRYDGKQPASLSFQIRGAPDMLGAVIASGNGLTTEEMREALLEEARKFGWQG